MATKLKRIKDDEPRVTIFDHEVRDRSREYRGGGVSGVFFLAVGIILLLNNLGTIPWTFWNYIGRFWPVILILMGIRIILGRSAPARIFMLLISMAVFGIIIIYGLSMAGSPLLIYVPNNLIVLSQQICGYSSVAY